MDGSYEVLGAVTATLGVIGFVGYMARKAAQDYRQQQSLHSAQTNLAQLLGQEFSGKPEEQITIPMRLRSRFGITPDEYVGLRTGLEKLAGPPVYEDAHNAPTYTPIRIYVAGGVGIVLEQSRPLKIKGGKTRAEIVADILGTYLHLHRINKKGVTEDDRKVYEGVKFYEAPAEAGEETREEPAPVQV